jgi:hypothetical protein
MTPIQLKFESLPKEDLWMAQHGYDIEESIDIIRVMKRQEKKYSCRDYLSDAQFVVDEECRKIMVEWCYQTVDFFKLSRDSVHVAMSCLDRFLGMRQGKEYLMEKSLYQLACITSLHMAIKTHEPVQLGISMLVQLCRGVHSEEQITDTEVLILEALEWAVNPPSPKAFFQHFIAMLPRNVSLSTRRDLLDLACYQTEMTLSEYSVGALSTPSATALASVINALTYCPEVNAISCSLFFRSLGKSTGCSRHTENVDEIKEVMKIQLDHVNCSPSPKETSIKHSTIERRGSCAVRARNFKARITGNHLSPVGVMER